jgi:hypothetical protein
LRRRRRSLAFSINAEARLSVDVTACSPTFRSVCAESKAVATVARRLWMAAASGLNTGVT